MGLHKEIERKWLLDIDSVGSVIAGIDGINMEQMYISFSPTIRIRKENNSRYVLCVKSKSVNGGLSRDEFEIEITSDDYDRLSLKAEGKKITKKRYTVPDERGYIMEIDVFGGELVGLAYMEVEFSSEEEAVSYIAPSWIVKEVTDEWTYKNAALARYGMPK